MRLQILLATAMLPLLAIASLIEVHPQESIQSAVYAASDGDTILIHEGIYVETVVLYGKTLTIGSQFLLDNDTTHIGRTSILADQVRPDTNSCFVYTYGERSNGRLVGLLLGSGSGTYWSEAEGFAGGAICVLHSGATVEHCIFENSSAHYGGGLGVAGPRWQMNAQAYLQDCLFRNCFSSGWGGGAYAAFCSLRVQRSEFESSHCVLGAGGIDVMASYTAIDSSSVRNCIGSSGGLFLSGCSGRVSDCLFESNASSNRFQSHLVAWDNRATIARCIFRNNASEDQSIILYGSDFAPIRFVGNIIENNTATNSTGTLVITSGSRGEVAYNIVRNNFNSLGGAITFPGPSVMLRVHHNTISGNISLDPLNGSAVLAYSLARPELDSNLIFSNGGVAVSYDDYPHPFIHAENNWWGDPSGPYHPTLNPTGRGDTLSQDSVYFIPWLTSPPDTTMPSSLDRRSVETVTTWRLLAVYPNPFNSEIRLVIAGFTRDDFRLTLHNLLGQQVDIIHSGALTGGKLHYRASPNLASGVYFVRASAKDGVQTEKIIFLK